MTSQPEPAILLKNLCVAFGKKNKRLEALRNVSASMPCGQITGLMGPDAAGKTTLMRVLAGLISPNAGSVDVFGMSPAKALASQPNSIGYMPQRFGLYEDLSVIANMRLYASLRGLDGNSRDELFKKLLAFTSLEPFTTRLAGNLSGGMKQKLGIACALLGNPRLLLLDEPGVGVDPQSRRELWAMVQQLRAGGMTVLWATSYLEEAARCPHLIMLNEGCVLYEGAPDAATDKARGKVYLLTADSGGALGSGQRRRELACWTQRPGVADALVQGKCLRIVVDGEGHESAREEILQKGGRPAPPRLEDAYMCMIGGIDKRPSPYSKIGGIVDSRNEKARIVANGLTKKFGDFTAADNITFKVGPGEIFGLLGPNGAGKSTTFRMLCGLLRPTSGACFVDGVDMLAAGSAARQRLGYMAQKFSLYKDVTVWQNIAIFADLYGLSRKRRASLLPILASALDLDGWLRAKTHTLPLGLKQRLALLCATLHEPPVLFLDEPTSGVDARTRRDFWKHISALTEAGASVLVTTHFMEEAEYCDRIALIYRGCMISAGTPDELKATVKNADDPTLEDAFIARIEQYDREHPLQ